MSLRWRSHFANVLNVDSSFAIVRVAIPLRQRIASYSAQQASGSSDRNDHTAIDVMMDQRVCWPARYNRAPVIPAAM
jgi:hypothetical protein